MNFSIDFTQLFFVLGIMIIGIGPILGFGIYCYYNGDKVFALPEKKDSSS
jgi:hypothetical protein